jgi:hypothetical protein
MANRAPVRQLLLAAGIGIALIGGPGIAAADPGDEAPQPGQVTATATCARGTASITVTLDFEFRQLPVRLDRVRPDEASLTKTTTQHEADAQVQKVVFEPVPVGEYNVHVARGDGEPADDVPVVVKPCGNPQSADELLRVEVDCQAGWGLVTFFVANPGRDGVVEYSLTTGYITARKVPVRAGTFLRIAENGIEDRPTYTASLTEGDKVVAKKDYTVHCLDGNAARLDVTAACAGTTGTAAVNVLNPNRVSVNYEVSLKGVTKKLTLNGGEKGTVAFDGIATGEHAVVVKGGDQTQARGSAKLDCGATTTTRTTTTETTTTTPVPQGRSDTGLANTGAAVGGLVGLVALALAVGGALVMIGRRRAHGNR